MIVSSINDLNLHDSEILKVKIVDDKIVLLLDYIEDYESMRCAARQLIFSGCTEARFQINPSDASPNSIQYASEEFVGSQRKVLIETNKISRAVEIVASEIEFV